MANVQQNGWWLTLWATHKPNSSVPNGLSWSLPELKCSALVFLEAEGGTVNKVDFIKYCLEFCCMLYKNIIFWNLCCHFRWQAIFLCFYVTVIFMKWSQKFFRYLELFRDTVYLEKNFEIFRKNWEFPETYLGDFSWYLYLGLIRPPLVSPRNNVWETSAEVRLCVWVVCLIDRAAWEICFNQSDLDMGGDASSVWNFWARFSDVAGKPVMASLN